MKRRRKYNAVAWNLTEHNRDIRRRRDCQVLQPYTASTYGRRLLSSFEAAACPV